MNTGNMGRATAHMPFVEGGSIGMKPTFSVGSFPCTMLAGSI
jgi:hypothetical protein